MNLLNKFHCGDTLTILKQMPADFVDCILTSPPYWGLRSYLPKDHPDKAKELGQEPNFMEYLTKLFEIFIECKRVIKPTGSIWINMGDTFGGSGMGLSYAGHTKGPNSILPDNLSYMPQTAYTRGWMNKCLIGQPERLRIKLVDDGGLILRNDIIWCKQIFLKKEGCTKGSAMPTSVKDRFNMTHEHLYHFTKKDKYYFDLDSVRIPIQAFENIAADQCPQFKASEEEIKKYPGKKARMFGGGKKDSINITNRPNDYFGHPSGLKNLPSVWLIGEEEIKDYGTGKSWHSHEEDDVLGQRKNGGKEVRLTHPNGKNLPSVWYIGTEPSKELHFAKFPKALCEIPILSTCPKDGVFLDPFSGSGTACYVARELGRPWIGIDLNPAYIAIAEKKMAQMVF